MKILKLTVLFLFVLTQSFAQGKPAYRIFNHKGKKVSYKKMLKALAKQDLVFFGEFHDNAIAHWLELEVLKDLDQKRNLILGAEMIEADNQEALSQYLKGEITQEGLDTLARLWSNHPTDYAPLVDYAKVNEIDFIATNIPRRYASMVYKNGGFEALENLTNQEKSWIATLPVPFDAELPTYKAIMDMMGAHGSIDLVKAQAIKDATMAHFILENYKSGSLFLHFNGAYHSDYKEGIIWYIQQAKKGLKIATISTVSQDDLKKLSKEHKGKADFIIGVDSDMTKTY